MGAVDGTVACVFGQVHQRMVAGGGFGLNNVQRSAGDASLDQRGAQSIVVHQCAAGAVDQNGGGLHGVDKVGVDNEMKEDFFVIRHIISLAKELGFICLAEGAENKSQIDELRALGCDVIQGYYYSKPISIEEYENKYLN